MALIIYLIAILITSQIRTGLQTYVSSKYYGNPIGNTLDSNGFQKLINAKLKARESELLASQSLTMNVDKNIANIFSSSSMVSGTIVLCIYVSSTERVVSLLAEVSTIEVKRKIQRQKMILKLKSFWIWSQIYRTKLLT